jgi:hypothetical protein
LLKTDLKKVLILEKTKPRKILKIPKADGREIALTHTSKKYFRQSWSVESYQS